MSAPAKELGTRLSLAGLPLEGIEETQVGAALDFEVTNNRGDCLSHYGIAREASVVYGLPLKAYEPKLQEDKEKASRAIQVRIECPDLCLRYTARIIRGASVQPSPLWLRERLAALGHSSINNIVDIANYVMLELGQPMHAFDLSRIGGGTVAVRRPRAGEKIRTLDGVERALPKDCCVIADGNGAIAIGGVMGGADSEISFDTRDILLESANFEPVSIRKTAKALGMRTEASFRFERSVDIQMAETASRRAAQMILEIAGGKAMAGIVDIFPNPPKPPELEFSRREWLRVMGADIADEEIEKIFAALGFQAKRVHSKSAMGSVEAAWRCRQPTWRPDVTREIDLVEEIARVHGYEKIPPRLPPARTPVRRLPQANAEARLCEMLVGLGYQEIVTIPLVNPEQDDFFPSASNSPAPAMLNNPLTQDSSRMRGSGIPNMVQALEWNVNHGQQDLRLYEIGKRYGLRSGVAEETRVLTLGATGRERKKALSENERKFDFADLRGDLDAAAERAGGLRWEEGGPSWLTTGRRARLALTEGGGIGCAGQLSRGMAEQFKLKQEVFLAEIELTPLLKAMEDHMAGRRFKAWPRFPAVERDFSLVIADATSYGTLEGAVRALSIPEVIDIEPVDLFRGASVGEGRYSLLLRVTFQSEQATLTDGQLSEFSARIVGALEQAGARLRGQ